MYVLGLFLGQLILGSAQFFPDQKLRQCEDGELSYQRLSVPENRIAFYMQTPALNERECVLMCYERLQFCNSVKFQPEEFGQDIGICSFAYYRGDCRREGLPDIITPPSASNMFSCIRCIPFGPSFIQGVEDTNEVGPALLIQNVVITTEKPVDNAIDASKIGKNSLSYREYKSFSFLLPECTGTITYSAQPTLMMTKSSVYIAGMEIKSVQACATLCYRQHFCVSAIWRNDECLLSYERSSSCSDKPLPYGYKDAVFISCIKCDDE